jgi:hypothetical protein
VCTELFWRFFLGFGVQVQGTPPERGGCFEFVFAAWGPGLEGEGIVVEMEGMSRASGEGLKGVK